MSKHLTARWRRALRQLRPDARAGALAISTLALARGTSGFLSR